MTPPLSQTRGAAYGASRTRSRLLIADDDPVVRSALGISLSDEFELAGVAGDAQEAIRLAELEHPDVALVDVEMPGGGLFAVQGIVRVSPATAIVVLSVDEIEGGVRELIAAGAVAYRRKGIEPRALAASLRSAITAHGAAGPT